VAEYATTAASPGQSVGESGARLRAVVMKLPPVLHRGRLVRRYKRFLADVVLEDGRELTVHCPNSGSMMGLDTAGSAVLVSDSGNPKRKLRMTLERVRAGRAWVGVNTMLPNRIVQEALERRRVPALASYGTVRPEVRFGERSRLDFLLEEPGLPRCWVEVKNATLRQGRQALFPDSVTDRGRKHLLELRTAVQDGDRGVLLFLVNRADCDSVSPADAIDPAYGATLREVAAAGVEVIAHRARLVPNAVSLGPELPVCL
jgi:sugar fermentation stimulation protein A